MEEADDLGDSLDRNQPHGALNLWSFALADFITRNSVKHCRSKDGKSASMINIPPMSGKGKLHRRNQMLKETAGYDRENKTRGCAPDYSEATCTDLSGVSVVKDGGPNTNI